MANTKILVCCHKKDVCVSQEPYFPIHVGKANSSVDLGIQGDDTGDNISTKNPHYAELTGMYWAWKNLKDVDIIGLCHYRRYFDFYGKSRIFMPFEVINTKELQNVNFDVPLSIVKKVSQGRVVVSKPLHYMCNLATDYCRSHISDDFRILQDVFKKTQSEKFVSAFNVVMFHNNAFIPYNMFIMTWKEFDRYCNWLFGVLDEVEKRIDVSQYSSLQTRVFAYMAERLLNVYIYAMKLSPICKPILKIDDSPYKLSPWLFLRNRVRGDLATKLAYSNTWL